MNLLAAGAAVLATLAVLAGCHHDATHPKVETVPQYEARRHQLEHETHAIIQREAARTAAIIQSSEEAARAAEVAPGADLPISDDVLGPWGDAIDRMRHDADAARTASGTGVGSTTRALPAS